MRIRHASGYESGYLHLSAFGPGIRAGVHVSQGQMIGRVGMTGLATGPHLHYELRKGGAVVNPMSEHRKLPPGEPIPAGEMEAFKAARDAGCADSEAGQPVVSGHRELEAPAWEYNHCSHGLIASLSALSVPLRSPPLKSPRSPTTSSTPTKRASWPTAIR